MQLPDAVSRNAHRERHGCKAALKAVLAMGAVQGSCF
jgi:hypothetical protein